MKLLTAPDPNGNLSRLIKLLNMQIASARFDVKMHLRDRKRLKDLKNAINKKGYSIRTIYDSNGYTHFIMTPHRVTHCATKHEGVVELLDTKHTAKYISELSKQIAYANREMRKGNHFNLISGIDPIG